MKRLLVFILLFISIIEIHSQISVQKEYDFVDNKSNIHGVRKVGIIVGDYNNKRYKYGCIDKNGNEVIPVKSPRINIYDDFIIVEATGTNGEEAFCGDGLRQITRKVYYDIIEDKQLFSSNKCFIVKSEKNEKYGIIDNKGQEVVNCIYDDMKCIDYKNAFFLVSLNRNKGIINLNGKEIIPITHSSIEGLNGFAIVDNQMLIKSNGKTIIESGVYDELNYLNGRVLWAKQGDKYAILDTKGNIIVPLKNYGKLTPGHINYSLFSRKKAYVIKNDIPDVDLSEKTVLCLFNIKVFFEKDYYKEYRRKFKINRIIYIDDKGEQFDSYEAAYNSNLVLRKQYHVDEDDKNIKKNLATIHWLSPYEQILQKEYNLKIGIKTDSKILSYSVSVNGEAYQDIKPIEENDYAMIISKNITLNEGNNIIKVSVTNESGTTQEEKTIIYKSQGKDIPTIEWLDFAATANKKDYQMKLGIKSKSKIEEVNVSVNGFLSRGIKPVNVNDFDFSIDRTITLSEGMNRIVVSVRNADGIATSEKVITYKGNTPIFNDKRIALVIGNSHYNKAENNLNNPENDARDMAEKLKELGFEVMLSLDATLKDMRTQFSEFNAKAKDYDVALFFYAGHGIQSKGNNYILPTDIDEKMEEVDLEYRCENMQHVLDVMDATDCKLKIVILDACRDNPLARSWHRGVSNRGLSLIQPPSGTLISYSTSPGKTASDGEGMRNSPYTAALLETLDIPNLELLSLFKTVNAEVKKRTKQSQNPWFLSDFSGDFYFNNQ